MTNSSSPCAPNGMNQLLGPVLFDESSSSAAKSFILAAMITSSLFPSVTPSVTQESNMIGRYYEPCFISDMTAETFSDPYKEIRLLNDRCFIHYINYLASSFEYQDIEAGYNHYSENIINEAIRSYGTEFVFLSMWVMLDIAPTSICASTIIALGRIEVTADNKWKYLLLNKALIDQRIEIRDAAIRSAEIWGSDEIVSILNDHTDSVEWLEDYKCRVIRDLTEENKNVCGEKD